MSTETNILLPAASVDIFIRNKETLDSARELASDWRFARVNITIREGDVETAIQNYQETQSPNLVIIETDTTDESFVGRLSGLSSYCQESTNAIVIGPVNDVDLYRNLTSMGVSDYLVNPVPFKILSEVIAQALINELGISGSRLIGVIGSKGGVGASTMSQALVHGLSEKAEHKTLLIDAAGGWSTSGVGMGFEPSATLAEAVRAAQTEDSDTIERMLFKPNDKLAVLASGVEPMLDANVGADEYERLLELMMTSYPVVVVDLSAAPAPLKKVALNIAHEVLLVTTPTLSSLRAARTLLQEVRTMHGGDTSLVDLVVNMVGLSSSKEVPNKDIEAALEHKPSVNIPFNPKLFIGCENEGKKLIEHKEGLEIVNKLLSLSAEILGDRGVYASNKNEGNVINQLVNKLVGKG